MSFSFRHSAKNLFSVVFERDGNVLFAVLPYCAVNCALLGVVEYVEQFFPLSFSPTGHGLMTLLVSFLVISKVNLTYERFRLARHVVGSAFLRLRELNQLVITLVEANVDAGGETEAERTKARQGRDEWKAACLDKITLLLDSTKDVLQSSELAKCLARNEGRLAEKVVGVQAGMSTVHDPMEIVQDLRIHLYVTGAGHDVQLLERIQLLTKLGEFVTDYREILDLASTPLPFSLIQMGRAFLFIWTFSMPLVLRQGPFKDIWSALIFLFFLTYGFIGLELVAMQLATPFGDGPNDIRVTALCNATVTGMERDLHVYASNRGTSSISQKRIQFANQKKQAVGLASGGSNDSGGHDNEYSMYHSMPFGA